MTRLIARTLRGLTEAHDRLRHEKIISVDTETTGLDPHTDTIHSVQIATEDGSWSVFIPRTSRLDDQPALGPLVGLLNSAQVLKLAQNASFDLKMLMTHYPDFKPVRWFDTMVAEKVLTAGMYKRTSLAEITERYLGKKRDKQIRTTFYDGTWDGFTWTPDLIDYAMEDVEDLGTIARMQMKKLKSEGLIKVAQLEMNLLPVWAKMEMRGVKYDREGGQEFAQDMRAKADELGLQLQAALEPFWQQIWKQSMSEDAPAYTAWEAEWDTIKSETGKRKGLTAAQLEAQKLRRAVHMAAKPKRPQPYEPLNPGSPTQLLPVLRATGLSLESTKKEVLEEMAGANEYIDLLLDWRQYDKLAGTFGNPLLESINSKTGRIHPSFNPCVATGRCSCSSPNLQQIPTRTDMGKRLRKLFVSEKGKKFVVADYSGIELVIIAVMSGDEVLLNAINKDLDLHSYTISHALSGEVEQQDLYRALVAIKEGRGTPSDFGRAVVARNQLEEIANIPLLSKRGWDNKDMFAWVKNLRDFFKTISYGTAYGLSKYGLARRLHFEIDAAEALIQLFFKTYPKVGAWLQDQGNKALANLYSTTAMGRKRYYRHPRPVTRDRVVELAQKMQEKDETGSSWSFLERAAKRELEKEYNSRINSVKRQGGNAPVQGTSADITKLAMQYVEQAIVGWDLYEGLLFPVHDELVSEVSEEHVDEMRAIMKAQMERAAMEILGPINPNVRIVVKPEVETYWVH